MLAAAIVAVVVGAIVAVLALPRTQPQSATAPVPTPTGAPVPTSPSPPGKVLILDYVAVPDTSPATFEAKASSQLSDPLVYGISWKFRWATLEPAPGQFDWTLVDQSIAVAAQHGKKAVLRVYSGYTSPAWVYSTGGARPLTFLNTDLSNPQQYPAGALRMPLPWDPRYLAEWSKFVAAFGARYDGNSNVYLIEMAGGGFIGEMCLPHSTSSIVSAWRASGYTDEADIGAWKTIIDAYRTAFPRTPTALDLCEPLGKGNSAAMVPVANYALERYPDEVYLQQNGLQAGYAVRINDIRAVLRAAAGRTVIGYQMNGGEGGSLSAKTGDRMTAFRVAVEDGARYVEVYQNDLADPANAPALAYLASGGVLT